MKSRFHTGAVWLEALLDFDNELDEHVEQAMKDQLRFQDGRLFRSLKRHIKATGKDEWYALFYSYRFMTDIVAASRLRRSATAARRGDGGARATFGTGVLFLVGGIS
jgi:hypothetical protein